jgi:hypothetical protein
MLRAAAALTFGSAFLVAASAHAQGLTAQDIAADAQRRAAQIAAATPAAPWGCVVLLCLANPRGPTAIAQCVDPIRSLWSALRSRRPFPTCPMAQGPRGGAYARPGTDYYDPCPPGTTEVPAGRYVTAARATWLRTGTAVPDVSPPEVGQRFYSSTTSTPQREDSTAGPSHPKLCGAGYSGDLSVIEAETAVSVAVYRELVLVPPASSPNFVEVLIDAGDGRGFAVWTRARY